jgi:hypothetical protein
LIWSRELHPRRPTIYKGLSTMFRRTIALAAALAVAGLAAITPGAAARTCPAGYTHAKIDGQQKCLGEGEYCSRDDNSEYRHYGYWCQNQNGTYRLENDSPS